MSLAKPWVIQLKQKYETILIPVTLQTHTTDASIKIFANNTDGAYFFSEEDGQTITTYDAAPGFTIADLDDDAAPSVFGAIIQVGDAAPGVAPGVEIVPSTIVAASTGLTALGTVTMKGASSSGVSLSKNLCFIFGLTGVDADAAISTGTFLLRVTYLKDQPV